MERARFKFPAIEYSYTRALLEPTDLIKMFKILAGVIIFQTLFLYSMLPTAVVQEKRQLLLINLFVVTGFDCINEQYYVRAEPVAVGISAKYDCFNAIFINVSSIEPDFTDLCKSSAIFCKTWLCYVFKTKSRNCGKPSQYYANHVACLRDLIICGDIEINPGPGRGKINIYYQNVRSVKNKMEDYRSVLWANLLNGTTDVVALCETWLNDHVLDSELSFPGYVLYRLDRTGKRGGGLLLLVNEKLHPTRLSQCEVPGCEIMWIELKASNRKTCVVGLFYRPPLRRHGKGFLKSRGSGSG